MEELPKRKALRLQEFNYTSNACYFVTICTKNKQMLFGAIVDNGSHRVGTPYMASAPPQGVPPSPTPSAVMQYTPAGEIAAQNIHAIHEHFPIVTVHDAVVMPNHVHLILSIAVPQTGTDAIYGVPTRLSSVIGSYKASVTRAVGAPVWQSRYYDHIIRDEQDYFEKANYMQNNPAKWLLGEE